MKPTLEAIKLLSEYGWINVVGRGNRCARCQKPIRETAILHPRTFRHLHVHCALMSSGLRNIKSMG